MKSGVELSGDWGQLERLFGSHDRELEKRVEFARQMIARKEAETMLESIKKVQPAGTDEEWDHYVSSLEIVEVKPKDGDRKSIVVLRCKPKAVNLAKKSADTTAVWVHPKGDRVSKLTMMLAKYGPWTLDKLPAKPPSDARVVYAKVSRREIDTLRQRIEANWSGLSRDLQRMGINTQKHSQADVLKRTLAVPDYMMVGLRYELGLSGYPSRPHWKPSIQKLRAQWAQVIMRDRSITDAVVDMKKKHWKQKPKPLPEIKLSEVHEYDKFTNKIVGA